ncbi:MAG: hypothetical protein E7666_07240 [Ruminococcaceae bacterium]|nr:hypothetical protein [Oscillospiraceae bacterium]
MLIDLHVHSSGASRCCKIALPEGLDAAREVGIDGIVLTNHYQKNYTEKLGIDVPTMIERYQAEFTRATELAAARHMPCFFGIEITMERYKGVHMVVYGADPDFLNANPDVFDATQEALYRTVHAAGGILVQAHPYRKGSPLMDPAWMDAVEINCHPLYQNIHFPEILAVAEQYRLPLTCGGDYHADTYRPKCGLYLPDDLRDTQDLANYIRTAPHTRLCVQDVNGTPFDFEYRRK